MRKASQVHDVKPVGRRAQRKRERRPKTKYLRGNSHDGNQTHAHMFCQIHCHGCFSGMLKALRSDALKLSLSCSRKQEKCMKHSRNSRAKQNVHWKDRAGSICLQICCSIARLCGSEHSQVTCPVKNCPRSLNRLAKPPDFRGFALSFG